MSQFSLKPRATPAEEVAPTLPADSAVPALATPEDSFPPPPAAAEPYQYKRPSRTKGTFFGVSTLIFIAACALGYYKYDEYKKHPPPPPPKPKQPLREVPLSANPLTAFKQAKEVIQNANDKYKAAYDEVASMDQAITPNPPPSAPKPTAGSPANSVPVTTPVNPATDPATVKPVELITVQPQANKVIAPPTVADLPAPSPAFLQWAQKVRISSIRVGTSTRVFIDRTTYQKNDLVEPNLGISFEDYNQPTRLLKFKERSGAVIEIKYGND